MSAPFTPRHAPARKSNLTLSAKQFTKIAGTIANVRRERQLAGRDLIDELEEQSHGTPQDASFTAEASFVRAPLNSRVPTHTKSTKDKGKARAEDLEVLPVDLQEALVLEDLLYVLMGIEGTHITFHADYSPEDDFSLLRGVEFVISPSLDASLRDLVERILPLATYYTAASAFVEIRSHLDYGLVNHALCASIRDMLKDYQTLLTQLEYAFTTSPSFSLQKLWFYVHPTLHTLSLIYSLITELSQTDDAESASEDMSDDEKNEELGLGPGLKAVLNEMTIGGGGTVKGGEVVAILWERVTNMSGDPSARELYRKLLRDAARPYVAMLEEWMTSGFLKDPYEEVMVKESKFINRGTLEMDYTDEYWERRYTLRDGSNLSAPSKRHQAGVPPPRSVGGRLPGGACIPPHLETWKHKILLAGKYLNVIRECGIQVKRSTRNQDEELVMDDEKFYRGIEDAYTYANRTLLKLLLEDQQLVPRLRSLKHFFFLSQSSFITHFLDLSASELRKSSKAASIVKLQSLLDLSFNSDSQDPERAFREDVKVTMAASGLYEWLLKVVSVSGSLGEGDDLAGIGGQEDVAGTGKDKDDKDKKALTALDALTLDYTVNFPLSLVISRKTILRYQLLFRFLLHLKHVEQSLGSMWIDHKAPSWRASAGAGAVTDQSAVPDLERWRRRVFLLRARMLAFIQQVLAFATFEVLEPNWRMLESKLAKVTTVDQLLKDHVDFLDTCLKECMLTSSKLLRIYSRLMVTCSTFAQYSTSFNKSANQALSALQDSGGDPASVPMQKRWEFLGKFEANFNHVFKVHLDCVQFYASSENVALLGLVVRLNNVRTPSA